MSHRQCQFLPCFASIVQLLLTVISMPWFFNYLLLIFIFVTSVGQLSEQPCIFLGDWQHTFSNHQYPRKRYVILGILANSVKNLKQVLYYETSILKYTPCQWRDLYLQPWNRTRAECTAPPHSWTGLTPDPQNQFQLCSSYCPQPVYVLVLQLLQGEHLLTKPGPSVQPKLSPME